jgi:putrescine transport system permease protein
MDERFAGSPFAVANFNPRARLYLFVCADANAGDLLIQQLEAGDGVGGWSTRWYSELFHDDAMMSAVGLSLTIATCAATAAAILGTIAAVVMVRFGRFRGSNGFAFMITAPLVMPDVITGLSLLLLFVALGHAIGWPSDRGMLTIWLAHVTFCTAYVAVVISSRLRELDHSIEEAAMD